MGRKDQIKQIKQKHFICTVVQENLFFDQVIPKLAYSASETS